MLGLQRRVANSRPSPSKGGQLLPRVQPRIRLPSTTARGIHGWRGGGAGNAADPNAWKAADYLRGLAVAEPGAVAA
jgi:hypothetical protein